MRARFISWRRQPESPAIEGGGVNSAAPPVSAPEKEVNS